MEHFLALSDFSAAELNELFDSAKDLKAKQKAGTPHRHLEGKTLGMIFEKSSTRTRVSFEVGTFQMGGHALFLSSRDIQMGRGEPIADTARVLSRFVDGIMIRTFSQAVVEDLAKYASIPVINGLTDLTHPCQVLTDLLTVIEEFGSLDGLTIAYVGDGNNMANSWLNAAQVLGFSLNLACPEGYRPDRAIFEGAKKALGDKLMITADPKEAVAGVHAINTDVWASMGQEDEAQLRRKAFAGYQIDAGLMALADPKAIFLHCLPAHRGEEVSDEVIEGPQSRVFDQAENRLHAQKAIMVRLMGRP
jgi:ornithine carbamoyltransferase